MNLIQWICLFCVGVSTFVFASPLSSAVSELELSLTADDYFSQHDYPQALKLWEKFYEAHPESVDAMEKISLLRLMLEGHGAAQKTIVEFLKTNNRSCCSQKIQMILREVQTKFVKDEAQSLYFQARSKIKLKNFTQSLVLLNQALKIEPGNLLILDLKATCEKTLGLFSKYYDTVKILAEVTLNDRSWTEKLLEAQYHFKDYKEIVNWNEEIQKGPLSNRENLVVGMAYLETQNSKKALGFLRKVLPEKKDKELQSVALYGVGKAMKDSYPDSLKYHSYWSKFIQEMNSSKRVSPEGWDPFNTAEKLAEVLKVEQKTL